MALCSCVHPFHAEMSIYAPVPFVFTISRVYANIKHNVDHGFTMKLCFTAWRGPHRACIFICDETYNFYALFVCIHVCTHTGAFRTLCLTAWPGPLHAPPPGSAANRSGSRLPGARLQPCLLPAAALCGGGLLQLLP
eukprot:scaffold33051_cov19-Tisochrysis_lutea.AAC.1